MKITLKQISLTLLLLLALVLRATAQTSSPASSEAGPLPGHTISNEQAIAQSSDIFVATVLGVTDISLGSTVYFGRAHVEVTAPLINKTAIPRRIQYEVSLKQEDGPEQKPIVGGKYIVFGENIGNSINWEAFKLLLATETNIALIKEMIASQLRVPFQMSYRKGPLTGHKMSNEKAAQDSLDIFVAAFKTLGRVAGDAQGGDDYVEANIEIMVILKGKPTGKPMVEYFANLLPADDKERRPILGLKYIVFAERKNSAQNQIMKLLPATSENITAVQAVIDSQAKNVKQK